MPYPDIKAAKWQIRLWWQDEFPMIPTECCLDNPNSTNALATAYKDAGLLTNSNLQFCACTLIWLYNCVYVNVDQSSELQFWNFNAVTSGLA